MGDTRYGHDTVDPKWWTRNGRHAMDTKWQTQNGRRAHHFITEEAAAGAPHRGCEQGIREEVGQAVEMDKLFVRGDELQPLGV